MSLTDQILHAVQGENPPQGEGDPPGGQTHSTSSSSSSSSGGSSAPAVDPREAQLESLMRSAYISLWAEPPTEAYVKKAAKSGMNVTEFVARERNKEAFKFTKAYKDEAKSLFELMRQLGAV